jgi:hypothetical protein
VGILEKAFQQNGYVMWQMVVLTISIFSLLREHAAAGINPWLRVSQAGVAGLITGKNPGNLGIHNVNPSH